MNNRYHLSDVLTGAYDGNGIFSNFVNPVWINEIPDSSELDLYFILNYGDRLVSPVLSHFIQLDGTINDENLKRIASIIYMRYKSSWCHIYKDYISDYNPLHNTSFTESTIEHKAGSGENNQNNTTDITNSGTTTNEVTTTNTGTSSNSSSSHVVSSGTGTGSNNNNIYGFDSIAAVPHDTMSSNSTTSADTSSTGTDSGETSNNGSETSELSTSGTNKTKLTGKDTFNNIEDIEVIHKKDGNIGVTETTQMLRNDIDFWKWSFIDRLCRDICDTIALSIYN